MAAGAAPASAAPVAAPVTATAGGSGNDTPLRTAVGANSGTHQLNGGVPQPFVAAGSFSWDGGGGADTLEIDNGGGLFAPAGGISFTGGAGTGDALIDRNGSATDGVSTPGGTPDAGTLVHHAGGTTQTIGYSGLEPISDFVTEQDFVVNGTSAEEQIGLVDGSSGLKVTGDDFESVEFQNKTNVRVNGLGGADEFTADATAVPAGLAKLTVNTGAQSGDKLNAGVIDLPGVAVELTTGGPMVDTHLSGAPDLRAASAALSAGSGIGAGNTIELDTPQLEAESDTGGISLADAQGVQIGIPSNPLRGLRAGSGGDVFLNAAGSITLADADGSETVRGGGACGNVTLQAVGAAADVTSSVDQPAITAPCGG